MSSERIINTTPEEIEKGKTMAIISYIGILCFIPLLMDDMKKNKFVMFHTEQSIIILIADVAIGILGSFTCLGWVLYAATLIFRIMGIMNAINGKTTLLPVIGQYGEKLNLVK